MGTRLLVSIVTYNSAQVIVDCLRNLSWMQDAQGIDAEIIVADNNSSDDTRQRIQGISEEGRSVVLVESTRNVGWGAGNNLTISARAQDPDYVLFCNPDAFIDETNFRLLLEGLQEHEPDAAMAVPFLEGPDGVVLSANPEWGIAKYFVSGYTSGRRRYERFQGRYRDRETGFDVRGGYASGALVLVSFAALRDAGFFDERIFMFNDDIDMTRRVLALGHTLIGVRALGHHIGGRGSRLGEAEAAAGTSIASLYYDSELVFVEKWYGAKWARRVAGYRWHIYFRVQNALRRMTRREPLLIEKLREPAGRYLFSQTDLRRAP